MRIWALAILALAACSEEDIVDVEAEAQVLPPEPATMATIDGDDVTVGDFGLEILQDGRVRDVAAYDIAAADLDGDGIDELLAATDEGVLSIGRYETRLISMPVVASIEVGDLNGDGVDDLIAMTREGLYAFVGVERALVVRFAAYGVADVDGDGDAELITAGDGWCSVFQWETGTSSTVYFPDRFQVSAVAFLQGELVLGGPDRLRFLRLDGTWRDLPSVPVAMLEVWDGGIVVLDTDGAAWMVRHEQFGRIESDVTAIEVCGSTLYLLRGRPSNALR